MIVGLVQQCAAASGAPTSGQRSPVPCRWLARSLLVALSFPLPAKLRTVCTSSDSGKYKRRAYEQYARFFCEVLSRTWVVICAFVWVYYASTRSTCFLTVARSTNNMDEFEIP